MFQSRRRHSTCYWGHSGMQTEKVNPNHTLKYDYKVHTVVL